MKTPINQTNIKVYNKEMGNDLINLNRTDYQDRSKYSHIDRNADRQQWLQSQQNLEIDAIWKDITHENIYYRTEYGKFQVFRNDISLEEVERYKVVLKDKQEFQKWKDIIRWRNNSNYLPRVEHFTIKNAGEICVSQFELNVFIERIPLRLADLTDIPYPQNLYFLLAVLKGFKYIFTYPFALKTFKVTESMICVNKEGEVKIWLNPTLSESLPVESKQNVHITHEQLLKTIIALVQRNTDQRDYAYPFTKYLSDKNIYVNGDFNTIIQQLYTYAKDMKVIIPKYAFSVRDILTRDLLSGVKFESQNSMQQNKGQQQMRQNKMIDEKSVRRNVSLKSLDINNRFKKQAQSNQDYNEDKTFPKDKTHGLLSQSNIIGRNQPVISNITLGENSNKKISDQLNQQSINDEIGFRHPLSERNFRKQAQDSKSFYVSRIGNNIIQIRQPDNPYKAHYVHDHSKNQKVFNSLGKPINYAAFPSAYEPNQQKNFYPPPLPKNNPNNSQTKYDNGFPTLFAQGGKTFSTQNFRKNDFRHIQRVNSYNIPIANTGLFDQNKPTSNEKPNQMQIQTIRPQQLASSMPIERINRQKLQNQNNKQKSRENSRKTSSFKNSLISEHNQNGYEYMYHQDGKLKYFTKKDSQQTLDPEIAKDLMKYLGEGKV